MTTNDDRTTEFDILTGRFEMRTLIRGWIASEDAEAHEANDAASIAVLDRITRKIDASFAEDADRLESLIDEMRQEIRQGIQG